MKHIVLSFVLLFPLTATGQNIYPPQAQFSWFPDSNFSSRTTMYLDKDSTSLKIDDQKKFHLGWQWGESKRLSEALGINSAHSSLELDVYLAQPEYFRDSISIIRSIPNFSGWWGAEVCNAVAVQWEPTLLLDSTQLGTLQNNRPYDEDKSVFGFRHIKPSLTTTHTDSLYQCLRLRSGSGYNDSLVLSRNWPDDLVRIVNPKDNNNYSSTEDEYHGIHWYVSLKIRRTSNGSTGNDIQDGTDVLKVKLKYKTHTMGSPAYIKFNQVPMTGTGAYTAVTNDGLARGYKANMTTALPNTTEMIIKRNIIPKADTFVTVSAYFICDGQTGFGNNNFLNAKIGPTNMWVEVEYLGGTNMAIDWIRVETPEARKLFWGEKDSLSKALIAMNLDHFADTAFINNKKILKRLYLKDEGLPMYWKGNKYVTKLVGDIMTAETDQVWYDMYEHYNGFPEYWSIYFKSYAQSGQPTTRWGYNNHAPDNSNRNHHYMLGLERGYAYTTMALGNIPYSTTDALYQSNLLPSVLKSYYEVQSTASMNTVFNTPDGVYPDVLVGCFTSLLESSLLWPHILNPESQQLMYSGKGWWSQANIDFSFNESGGSIDPPNKFLQFQGDATRFSTAEELSYYQTLPLFLGAKGLSLDGDWSNASELDGSGNFWNIARVKLHHGQKFVDTCGFSLDTLNAYDFVNSDLIGSDFLHDGANDYTQMDKYFKFDSIAYYSWINADRVYFGRRSARLKTWETYNFVRKNETELLKLDLKAHLSKGFKKYYTQHPGLASNYMDKYVSTTLEDWKIRPIDRTKLIYTGPTSGDTLRVPYYENEASDTLGTIDSSFYDATVLFSDDDPNGDSLFYLGVVNRRTDPLVYWTGDSIRFIAYAEFIDSCDQAKNPNTYQLFRDHWWKRLGAREINIPFNVQVADTNIYPLLLVSELSGHLDPEAYPGDTLYTQMQYPFYEHLRDTVIRPDQLLSLRLLPGQGKLLRVQILYPGKISGDLSHSNQSKLVSYPVRESGVLSDTLVQFHATYFKTYKPTPPYVGDSITGVYYAKSYPISRNAAEANIKWMPEILVSDFVPKYPSMTPTKGLPSSHPSIVVREDDGESVAYIVYSCNPLYAPSPLCSIILKKYNADTTGTYIPIGANNWIANYLTKPDYDMENYGTPVINASAGYNYLAWSDFRNGIMYGAMEPDDNTPFSIDTIKTVYCIGDTVNMKHPSLNVYSDIDAGEDNAALVWQQDGCGTFNTYHIYYTRLRANGGTVINYLSDEYRPSGNPPISVNFDSSVVRISTVISSSTKPVVYRDLKDYRFNMPNVSLFSPNRKDVVMWEDNFPMVSPTPPYVTIAKQLQGTMVLNMDTNNLGKKWRVGGTRTINPGDGLPELIQPNIAQASVIYHGSYSDFSAGDYQLNFVSNGKILNFSGYINDFFSSATQSVTDLNIEKIANGELPHLSKYLEPIGLPNTWKNRRIYNYGHTGSNPDIWTSALMYYRETDNEYITKAYYGYERPGESHFVSTPTVNGDEVPLNLPYATISDTPYEDIIVPTGADTMYSQWFTIASNADLKFHNFKNGAYQMVMKIQKLSDSSYISLSTSPMTAKYEDDILAEYTLINGHSNSFRLAFINSDTNLASYGQMAFMNELSTWDTVALKTVVRDRQVIDLSGGGMAGNEENAIKLIAYPNPTNGILKVMAALPSSAYVSNNPYLKANPKLIVSIIGTIGEKVTEFETEPGKLNEIDLSKWSKGIYLIEARLKGEQHLIDLPPAFGKVVLQK